MTNKTPINLTERELREFLYNDKDLTTEDFDNEFETGLLDDYSNDSIIDDSFDDEKLELETEYPSDLDGVDDYTNDDLDSELLTDTENNLINEPVLDDAYSTIQNNISQITTQLTNIKVNEFKTLIQQLENLILQARKTGREQLVEQMRLNEFGLSDIKKSATNIKNKVKSAFTKTNTKEPAPKTTPETTPETTKEPAKEPEHNMKQILITTDEKNEKPYMKILYSDNSLVSFLYDSAQRCYSLHHQAKDKEEIKEFLRYITLSFSKGGFRVRRSDKVTKDNIPMFDKRGRPFKLDF
jgi:hypothetical protein